MTDNVNPYYLPAPDIHWDERGTPTAAAFDDKYFSRGEGLAESRYVFLEQNRLRERWSQLPANADRDFVIGETGFGTGLNFLAAWQLWRTTAPAGRRLCFVSAEKYPLTREQLEQALSHWDELADLAAPLLAQYPERAPGIHRLDFDGVTLHLLFGDADALFAECLQAPDGPADSPGDPRVDAWFLDGFAPAKNPGMWTESLFQRIARLSHTETSFATFTAAGAVKRGLRECGFSVEKFPGFGTKRDMLRGAWRAQPGPPNDGSGLGAAPAPPARPQPVNDYWAIAPPAPPSGDIAVIGAGLAGATTADALARRGRQVTVFDSCPAPGQGASGNPQGILYTKLSPQPGALNWFTLHSYLYARRYWPQRVGDALHGCGVLQLAFSEREAALQAKIARRFQHLPSLVKAVDAARASELAGVPLSRGGLWFDGAGWLQPPGLCAQLCDHPLISLHTDSPIDSLHHDGHYWQLSTRNGVRGRFTTVVIANAHGASRFPQTQHLPLKSIRGQITQLAQTHCRTTLRSVICHEGYIAPAHDGQLTLGATFDIGDPDPAPRGDDHRRNLDALQHAVPGLLGTPPDRLNAGALPGRVGFRCTTPDYLPVAGPAPQPEAFLKDYAALRKNAKTVIATPGAHYPHLYLNLAHGSRGLSSTPACAEWLAELITGSPPSLPWSLRKALHPGRFLIRDLIRNRR